ncbi:MAG: hypothetical protein ACXACY_31435 [Candidatus Hodarchaeales archaeon]|jgi:hypothetical protein
MNEEERLLRENIQAVIKFVKEKRLNEEIQLRKIIRSMLDQELSVLNEAGVADTDPTPNKSTGINVLEDLLKKIIPVLEVDYKILTTSEEQRKSFRAHVINAIVNSLRPVEVNNEAEPEQMSEEINIDIIDDEENPDLDKINLLIFVLIKKRKPMMNQQILVMRSVLKAKIRLVEIWPTVHSRKLNLTSLTHSNCWVIQKIKSCFMTT